MKKDNFAERLKLLRKKSGLTQEELAERIGVSIMTLRRWEWGERTPRMDEIEKLVEAIDVTVDELLNGKNSEKWVLKIVIGDEDEEMVDLTHDMLHVTTLNATQNGVFIKMLGNWDAFMDDEKFNDLLEQIKQQRNEVLATGEHVFKININISILTKKSFSVNM